MSYILCLETSAKACTIAISSKGQVLYATEAEGENEHSRSITLMIETAMQQLGLSMKQLVAVAVSKGPGSYTGLRVGASCAKGLCYALNIPLIAIPTLSVVAYPIINANQSAKMKYVPMIDARRMEVYYTIYDHKLRPLVDTDNLVLTPDVFHDLHSESVIYCGDGAHKMSDLLVSDLHQIINSQPRAENMAAMAFAKFEKEEFEDLAYFVPFYLKPPNITKSKKKAV